MNTTNKKITIRTATSEDANELSEIAKLTFALACPPTAKEKNLTPYIEQKLNKEVFENYIDSKSNHLLVAQINSKIVGFGLLQNILSKEAELSRLYILPNFHGLGIGTKLAKQLILFATEKQIPNLTLCVYKHNNKAKQLYKKLGFTFKEEYKFVMGSEIHDDEILILKTSSNY